MSTTPIAQGPVDVTVGLLTEAADELAWLHREYLSRSPLSEGVPRITRLLQKIEAYTGHVTASPYIWPGCTGSTNAWRLKMQTKEQVAQAFKAELQALLDKYGAELEAKDHYQGYPEWGEDVRMTVNVPAIYDADHNCLREYTEIDLGRALWPTSNT